MKSLVLRDKPIGAGNLPLICMPLVGRDGEELLAELREVLQSNPDLIEWRVDFFAAIHDTREVLATAHAIRQAAGNIPIIFTRRSEREGGHPNRLLPGEVATLYEEICASGDVDMIDYELSQGSSAVQLMRAASRQRGVALILSFHDFRATPADEVLAGKIHEAVRLGADVAKIAVMPQSSDDVTRLLHLTREASATAGIPLITMAMGELGLRSRIEGWKYGSAVTFAAGKSSSAPGQIAATALRAALAGTI